MAQPTPGLFGVSIVSQAVVSDVEGLFGGNVQVDINVVYAVRDQFGNAVRGIGIDVRWDGIVQPDYAIALYDPTVLYGDKYPEGKAITIHASGGRYTDNTQTFTLEPSGFHRIDLVMVLPNAYAFSTRRHYT